MTHYRMTEDLFILVAIHWMSPLRAYNLTYVSNNRKPEIKIISLACVQLINFSSILLPSEKPVNEEKILLANFSK